jgi:glycosyltransferase involved in cell wall biosynthesis
VSPLSIHPMIHGGAVRIRSLIQQMSAWCDVSAFVFIGGTDDPDQRRALEPLCEHVFFQQAPSDSEKTANQLDQLPPSVSRYASPEISRRLEALVAAHHYDIVHLECTEMGYYVPACKAARVVLVEHDLSFRSYSRQRSIGIGERFSATDRIGRGTADGLRQRWFEVRACDTADQVHVMSNVDREHLATLVRGGSQRIRVIPNGVDTQAFDPPHNTARRDVLFLGSFPHLPNLDAFDYLTEEIWPAARRLVPDARITVAGARPPQRVLDWDGRDGITVVGEVENVVPLYHGHRLLLVPLRAGSGTRLKILEALASSLPVVSTSIGVEGIELSTDAEVLVADEPSALAEATAKLLLAPESEIEEIGLRGRELVVSKYDWGTVGKALQGCHKELLSAVPPRNIRPSRGENSRSTRETAPELSIIIPTSSSGALPSHCIKGVKSQHCSKRIEIVCVDWGSKHHEISRMKDLGARVIRMTGDRFDQGMTVNTGAEAARGQILVFVSHNTIPTDESWVEKLTIPFDHENPPSAVQGAVHGHLSPCTPYSDPELNSQTRGWVEAHSGFAFSTVNAAIRRDVWEQFPFHPGPVFEDRCWQHVVQENGHLILPCWEAAVRYTYTPSPFELIQLLIAEGRGWRHLGVRCSRLFAPGLGRGRARANLARLLGIFLGNHRMTPWPRFIGPV